MHGATRYNGQTQYSTIQILLSTPHGGFSETTIDSTGNLKNIYIYIYIYIYTQELSIKNT